MILIIPQDVKKKIARSLKLCSLQIIGIVFGLLGSMTLNAAIDVYDFDSVQQEAQYRGLIEELRCPKCQNQNLAGSDAPIAQDLKQKTYNMVKEGRSDSEILAYMQERYGDFISYKPPVRPSTWILWFFPPLLLIMLIVGWFWQSQRRQQIARGQNGVIVAKTAASLTDKEKAKIGRLLANADESEADMMSKKDKK